MGSKFVKTYTVDINKIESIVGSNDYEYKNDLNLNEEEIPLFNKIITKSYSRDPNSHESPDAADIINVFELICAKEATEKNVFEVYVDDESSPELFKFVYSSWSKPDNIEIPMSEWGSPSVTYISASDLKEHYDSFTNLINEGTNDEDFISDDDLRLLVNQVKAGIGVNNGMFIFFEE